MAATRVAVLGATVPSDWQARLATAELFALGEASITDGNGAPAVDVALVDGARDSAVRELRASRPRLPYVQPIVVADAERRVTMQRAITLSPGLGEVWIVTPQELNDELIARAAQIGAQRRRHAVLRQQKERVTPHAPALRRPVITDAFLAAVLQVAKVAVFSLDASDHILSVNPAAERLFHINGEDALGRSLLEVITPLQPAEAHKFLSQTQAHVPDLEFEMPDGGRRIFEMNIAPVPDRADPLRVLVAHDISDSVEQRELLELQAYELEQQAEQMAGQAAELENLMNARSRFYAAMNHEIRTPINAILGYNDLILAGIYGDLSEEMTTSIQRSQRAAHHLLELVNDVLDLSKIEAGRVAIVREWHVLPDVIRDILQTIEPTVVESGSPIECVLPCMEPVYTDARRVRQIVMNLVSNAVKFGSGKPITIRCEADGADVRIDVIDRGIGIPEEQLPLIFEEFVQLRERRQRGTGLGLAISKQLAELLGGRMEVKSEVGQGSTFSLVLPT
jgi:PAS domain S-box-containing protein